MVGFLILAILVWQTAHMLLVIFVGVLLALFLRGLSDWVSQHTRLPSSWALALVVMGLLGMAGLAGYLLAPEIGRQVGNLEVELPRAVGHLEEQLRHSDWGRQLLQVVQHGGKSVTNAQATLSKAPVVASSVIGAAAGVVICLFVGIYIAVAPRTYSAGAILRIPMISDTQSEIVGHRSDNYRTVVGA